LKKFLRDLIFGGGIVIILSLLIDHYVFEFFYVFHKRSKIGNVSGKNYDVLFLGNSRCANSVIPSVFSSQIGLSSFNLGWAAANPRELYAALKIYLSRNTTPAYVFIQIDKNGFDTGVSKLAIQPLLKYYNRNVIDEYFPPELLLRSGTYNTFLRLIVTLRPSLSVT
jgi:hypothetical protein